MALNKDFEGYPWGNPFSELKSIEMHRLDVEKRCPVCGSQNRAINVIPKPK